MIKIENVTKKFGKLTAVNALSLHVRKGEILGLVGPDGAGKTTLLRMLVGVMTKYEGSITVMGSRSIENIKQNMGYIPQKFSLYRDLTVMENIDLIGALYGADRRTVRQRAEEILTFTGLWQFRDRLSDQLSGGMKQKLALAAGLMHKPALFFLDEPTTGVDPVSRREFWQLLYRLNEDGMTIIAATPYMDEAELCHRVAFMMRGHLVACMSPTDFIQKHYPHHILEVSGAGKKFVPLLADLPLIDINAFGDTYHLVTNDIARTRSQVTKILEVHCTGNFRMEEIPPSLEDVFVALIQQGGLGA